MIPPRAKTRAFALDGALTVGVLVVVVATMQANPARADVAFRKKKTPSADTTAAEPSPTGGDSDDAAGGESTAPPAKTEYVPQAEDRDKPRDPMLLQKQAADAALAKKKAPVDTGPPIYEKWQFWAIVGGVAVGVLAAVFGGLKLAHEANGGDIRACSPDFANGMNCFGQGR
jgi:hypothetical protein